MLCLFVVCIVDCLVSVAITDRPVAPLSFGCCLQPLTDAVTSCRLCLELCHVGCHDLLADGVVCCGLVDHESAVVLFDHGSSIRGQMGRMGQAETTSSGVTLSHLIGLPLVRRHTVAGSFIARAIRYAPLMVGVYSAPHSSKLPNEVGWTANIISCV